MKFRQHGWILLGFYLVHRPAVFKMAAVNGEASTGGATYCNASYGQANEKGTVTCYFTEDVSLTKRNFKVQRKDFTEEWKPDADTILDCFWPEGDANFTCAPEDGCYVKGSISAVVTIVIQSVTERFEGDYVCQLVGDNLSTPQTCNITLTEPEGALLVWQIIVIAAAVAVGAVIIGVVVFLCKRRTGKRREASRKPKKKEETRFIEECSGVNVADRRKNFE